MTSSNPSLANSSPIVEWQYETSFSVPFHLCDPVGVLFFGNIYAVVHSILEDWGRAAGLWPVWFGGEGGLGFPIRHCEADYLRFLKYGETFAVRVRCASLSESSVVLETEFLKDSMVHARVRTVHTAVDLSVQKKARLPAALRELLSPAGR